MKKTLLTIFIVLVTLCCFSQNNLQKVTKKNGVKKEVFFVLKNSPEIKQGEYKKYLDKKIVLSGEFTNNKVSGIWTYYNNDESVFLKFNFDNDSTIFCSQTNLSRSIAYFGDNNEVTSIIMLNMMYPDEAILNGEKGTVLVNIFINKFGDISDYKISKSISPLLDNEAIRVTKLIPEKWLPAIWNGKPIDSKITVPITFNSINN